MSRIKIIYIIRREKSQFSAPIDSIIGGMEDKREDCQNYSVLYCVRQWYAQWYAHI